MTPIASASPTDLKTSPATPTTTTTRHAKPKPVASRRPRTTAAATPKTTRTPTNVPILTLIPQPTAQSESVQLDPLSTSPAAVDGGAVPRFVDPATLVIGANVRRNYQLNPTQPRDAEFLASIAQHGVLEPITVTRATPDEAAATNQTNPTHAPQWVVRRGQRRALAAQYLKLAQVPVHVIEDPGDVRRILEQLDENTQRLPHSTTDTAAALFELTTLGLTPTQVAKRTRASKAEVTAALVVAQHLTHADAVVKKEPELSLADLALLAEFAHDQDQHDRVLRAIRHGRGEHEAQIIRHETAKAAALTTATEQSRKKGLRIAPNASYWEARPTTMELGKLANADTPNEPLDADAHRASCGGHAVRVTVTMTSTTNAKGKQTQVWEPVITPVCVDYKKHGHRITGSYHAEKLTMAQMTPAEQHHAREKRSQTRENNAATDAAKVVRLKWLETFVRRLSTPHDYASMIAATLVYDPTLLTTPEARRLFHQWRRRSYSEEFLTASKRGEAYQLTLTLVVVIAGVEASMKRDWWKNPLPLHRRYLAQLHRWGYPLSALEKRIVKNTADDVEGTDVAGQEAENVKAPTVAACGTTPPEIDEATADGPLPATTGSNQQPTDKISGPTGPDDGKQRDDATAPTNEPPKAPVKHNVPATSHRSTAVETGAAPAPIATPNGSGIPTKKGPVKNQLSSRTAGSGAPGKPGAEPISSRPHCSDRRATARKATTRTLALTN